MNGKVTSSARSKNSTIDIYESGFQGGEVVSTGPVALLAVVATNKGASTVFVMIFDSTAAPSGAATLTPIAVPAGTTVAVSYSDTIGDGAVFGVSTASGLSWGASTSATSYTADSSDISVQIRYMA